MGGGQSATDPGDEAAQEAAWPPEGGPLASHQPAGLVVEGRQRQERWRLRWAPPDERRVEAPPEPEGCGGSWADTAAQTAATSVSPLGNRRGTEFLLTAVMQSI